MTQRKLTFQSAVKMSHTTVCLWEVNKHTSFMFYCFIERQQKSEVLKLGMDSKGVHFFLNTRKRYQTENIQIFAPHESFK